MTVSTKTFELDHGLELILYVANRVTDATFHSISKILYFADKLHLSRYGRLMSGDSYVAMKHGPVPSAIYDLLKFAGGKVDRFTPPEWAQAAAAAIEVPNAHSVRPRRCEDSSQISASEKSCLDQSIAENADLSFGQLTDKSHDGAWNEAGDNDLIDLSSIARTLPNAVEVLAHLNQP